MKCVNSIGDVNLDAKHAIIIMGLPGTGKTTISKKITSLLNSFYCSVDFIRSKIFDNDIIKEDRDYSLLELKIIYNALSYIVEIIAKNNNNIVIDGVFRDRETRKKICDKLTFYGYSLHKFYIVCDDKDAIKRVEHRKNLGTFSPAGIDGFKKIKNEFVEPNEDECFLKIYNSGELNDIIKFIYEQIEHKSENK